MALYSDAWVDDARLVVLNAVDAAERGAEIATRTEFLGAEPSADKWHVRLSGGRNVSAKNIVNAAGPWVEPVLKTRLGTPSRSRARLVKGTHILVPRLYEGEHAYTLQQPDGRIVFALPYGDYSLVGTTEIPVDAPEEARATPAEIEYLCDAVNGYFVRRVTSADVVWTYAGIRALHDDGAGAAQAVTRDYRLELSGASGPKLLSVFGGKLTTARALAEEALDRVGIDGPKLTDSAALPGGDLGPAFDRYFDELRKWMPEPLARRLSRAYGTRLKDLLGSATSLDGLGQHFGGGLYEVEVRHLIEKEFARTADDILWRRSKLGLALTPREQETLTRWIEAQGPS